MGVPNKPFQMIRVHIFGWQEARIPLLTEIRKQTALPCVQDQARYRTEGDDFLRHIVICDETWVHHYISETEQASMKWLIPGEATTRKVKTRLSAGKVLATFFLRSQRHIAR